MPNLPIESDVHPLLPVVKDKVDELAMMPPGPNTAAAIQQVMALIVAMLQNQDIAAILPASWKAYVAAIIAALAILGGGLGIGRYVVPSVPDPIPIEKPAEKAPIIINVGQPNPASASPILAPPSLAPKHAKVYRTAATPEAEIAKLTPGITAVDPKTYPAGSTYPFNGKSIPLPCASIMSSDGQVLDVVPFTTAEDLINRLTKVK